MMLFSVLNRAPGEGGHLGVVDQTPARRAREQEPVRRERLRLERALALGKGGIQVGLVESKGGFHI